MATVYQECSDEKHSFEVILILNKLITWIQSTFVSTVCPVAMQGAAAHLLRHPSYLDPSDQLAISSLSLAASRRSRIAKWKNGFHNGFVRKRWRSTQRGATRFGYLLWIYGSNGQNLSKYKLAPYKHHTYPPAWQFLCRITQWNTDHSSDNQWILDLSR